MTTSITRDDYYDSAACGASPPLIPGNPATATLYDRTHGRAENRVELASGELRGVDTATLIGVVPDQSGLEVISDAQLMAAVAEGDSTALEQLYDRHVRSCFGLALRIVQEPSLAEEIVQEVFIKLWSRPQKFSPARGIFHNWLLTLVRNQALDKLRQAKFRAARHVLPSLPDSSRRDNLIELLPDAGPTPHDYVWMKETADVVRRALSQLPSAEYQTITLAYFSGLSHREIADKLQKPLGTVKTHTRSALRRLRHVLAAQGALSD